MQPRQTAWLATGMLLALLAALGHLHFMNHKPEIHGLQNLNSDLLPRWIGIRAAFSGEDPYSPGVLREIQTKYYRRPLTPADQGIDQQGFWYPAYAAIILGPFAVLPWNAANLAFFIAVPPLFIAGLWLCIRTLEPSREVVWIATSFTFVSWPVMWALRLQQPTLLAAAFVFLAFSLIVRGNDIPAGALLAASTIKPQLVAPLILWLFLWAVLQRRYRLLASFTCAMAALLIPTEILVPNWFPHWIRSVATYSDNTNSAWPLVCALGNTPGVVATVALVAVSAFVLWRLRSADPQSPYFALAFSLVLATALCVTPTKFAIIYNQILLAPAAVLIFCWKPAGYHANVARCLAMGLFLLLFFVLFLTVLIESIFGPSKLWYVLPFGNIPLPAAVTVALLVQYWDVTRTTSSTQPEEFATAMA